LVSSGKDGSRTEKKSEGIKETVDRAPCQERKRGDEARGSERGKKDEKKMEGSCLSGRRAAPVRTVHNGKRGLIEPRKKLFGRRIKKGEAPTSIRGGEGTGKAGEKRIFSKVRHQFHTRRSWCTTGD